MAEKHNIPEIDGEISLYTSIGGGSTVKEYTEVKLEINDKEETIIEGYGIKDFHISYDIQNRVLVIYHCGGSITSLTSVVNYNDDIILIQPIINDFNVEGSTSRYCKANGLN